MRASVSWSWGNSKIATLVGALIIGLTGPAGAEPNSQRSSQSNPEMSIAKDRQELESLRKDIPAEKRQQNDERAFMEEFFVESGKSPGEIRQKFQKSTTKKRQQFQKSLADERKAFSARQKKERDEFMKAAKAHREDYLKSRRSQEDKKQFLGEQDLARKEFLVKQKEERENFEADVKSRRSDFEDNFRSLQSEFNQRHRDYTKNFDEKKKQDKQLPSKRNDLEKWQEVEKQYEYIKKKNPIPVGP